VDDELGSSRRNKIPQRGNAWRKTVVKRKTFPPWERRKKQFETLLWLNEDKKWIMEFKEEEQKDSVKST